jgi:hypothetical protein
LWPIKIELAPGKNLINYRVLPKVREGAVVRELKMLLGYDEEAMQASYGFGNTMLPDL